MGESLVGRHETYDALMELRNDVEMINTKFSGEFRQKVIEHDEICTVTVDEATYGFRLTDLGLGRMKREIWVRFEDGGPTAQTEEEMGRYAVYLVPIFAIFFNEGYTDITIQVVNGVIKFTQLLTIAFLMEHQPGIVVPGRKS